MIARHIHHALAQVQELQERILSRQRFRGYSGRARMTGGTAALLGALIMSLDSYPSGTISHIIGWGSVFALAVLINGCALSYWFLYDPEIQRETRKLSPVLEIIPPLLVGGVLTLALILHHEYDYLFGMWMCLFGLANIATRHVVPRPIGWIGVYYVAAGTVCLLTPAVTFENPWPMGLIFGLGEWIAGLVLHYDGTRPLPLNLNPLLQDEPEN